VAHDLRNPPSPPELLALLREAEADLAARLQPDTLTAHPHLAAWREAFRQAGIKPADFRPSVEALARRILKGDPLPAISTLVDLGTLLSVRHLAPIGAHAIDQLTQDIELRLADGTETFTPFGSETVEHPLPGEIIFAEGQVVLTRRWTWRQSQHTLVTPETTAVEVNVDILPPLGQAEAEAICAETAALLARFCGGAARWRVLSQEQPVITLER
jgi:DNA/RNA-binding domain of Phe-tRNA-synthetase-like protein